MSATTTRKARPGPAWVAMHTGDTRTVWLYGKGEDRAAAAAAAVAAFPGETLTLVPAPRTYA